MAGKGILMPLCYEDNRRSVTCYNDKKSDNDAGLREVSGPIVIHESEHKIRVSRNGQRNSSSGSAVSPSSFQMSRNRAF